VTVALPCPLMPNHRPSVARFSGTANRWLLNSGNSGNSGASSGARAYCSALGKATVGANAVRAYAKAGRMP